MIMQEGRGASGSRGGCVANVSTEAKLTHGRRGVLRGGELVCRRSRAQALVSKQRKWKVTLQSSSGLSCAADCGVAGMRCRARFKVQTKKLRAMMLTAHASDL